MCPFDHGVRRRRLRERDTLTSFALYQKKTEVCIFEQFGGEPWFSVSVRYRESSLFLFLGGNLESRRGLFCVERRDAISVV